MSDEPRIFINEHGGVDVFTGFRFVSGPSGPIDVTTFEDITRVPYGPVQMDVEEAAAKMVPGSEAK